MISGVYWKKGAAEECSEYMLDVGAVGLIVYSTNDGRWRYSMTRPALWHSEKSYRSQSKARNRAIKAVPEMLGRLSERIERAREGWPDD